MIDIENVSENNKSNEQIPEENLISEKQEVEESSWEAGNDEKPKNKLFRTVKKTKEIVELKEKLSEMNDKYIRLSAEFDNYRKRTLKEKMEIIKAGGESILVNILPVVDDFERAMASLKQTEDKEAIREGVILIYTKFKEFLNLRGVKEIDCKNQDFNTDLHEAVTKIPAPDENMKGKIVDVIQKGYYLNDKVIRFSKVVIGE